MNREFEKRPAVTESSGPVGLAATQDQSHPDADTHSSRRDECRSAEQGEPAAVTAEPPQPPEKDPHPWRAALKISGIIVANVGGILTIALYGSKNEWWEFFASHWVLVWRIPLLVLAVAFVVMASIQWLGNPSRQRRPPYITAGLTICASVVTSLGLNRKAGAVLVGVAVGTVSMLLWLSAWLADRRRSGEGSLDALQNGLLDWGKRKGGRLYNRGSRWLRGPRPDDLDASGRKLMGKGALIVGLAVVLASWLALTSVASVAAYTVSLVLSAPKKEKPVPSPSPPPSSPDPEQPAGNPSGTPSTTVRRGALHCNYPVGEGRGIPNPVRTAVAKGVAAARRQFQLCPTAELALEPTTGVYQQPVFTYDGEGAVVLAWELDGTWVVTFVSSDDAAAYRSVSPTLDWKLIGLPHPFVRCDGLWMQVFQAPGGVVAGVGLRDRADTEGSKDRPAFVWGTVVEDLLQQPGSVLQLPAGPPTADAGGPSQYFFERTEPVRAPHRLADKLTVADLLAHCRR